MSEAEKMTDEALGMCEAGCGPAYHYDGDGNYICDECLAQAQAAGSKKRARRRIEVAQPDPRDARIAELAADAIPFLESYDTRPATELAEQLRAALATKEPGRSEDVTEPVFILRAQDLTAPLTIGFWIQHNPHAPMSKLQPAADVAAKMDAWPKRKRAD